MGQARPPVDLDGSGTLLGGGTGTPKLLTGADEAITVIANTGDDVEFGDLFVCPDVDACLFASAGLIDTDRWWGIASDTEETATWLATLADDLGLTDRPAFRPADEQTAGRELSRWRRFDPLPEFMLLGDRDRAIHRVRGHLLDRGVTLTQVTRRLGAALGTAHDVVPMSDDPVASIVHTDRGEMHFQEFWVGFEGAPRVDEITFRGIEAAAPTAAVRDALAGGVIVIGPSNPVTSLGPILGLDGVRRALRDRPVVAVSPFLGETAFSGPAIELMEAAGLSPGTAGLTEAYPFMDAAVLDTDDPTDLEVSTVRTDLRIERPEDARRIWAAAAEAIDPHL